MIRTIRVVGELAGAVVSMALLSIVMLSISPFADATSAATVNVVNAIQFKDASGNLLHAHGGGMIKVGSFYYWFGENRDGTNLVSAYRSTDLKNWTFRAHVLRKNMGGELATANIERPKVLFNALTGTYVLWAHKENGVDYGEARVAVASASNVEGPYIYHGSFRPLGYDSRDMTVFNDNGTAYLISATRVNADLNIYRLTHDFLDVESLVRTLWPGQYREAPAMFKRGSTYFLVTSGATGWNPNQAKYATASSIRGRGARWRTSPIPRRTARSPPTSSRCRDPRRRPFCIWATAGPAPGADPVNDSKYVWLPLSFPSSTSLAMSWYPSLNIDSATGAVTGVGFSVDQNAHYDLVNRRSNKLLNVKASSTASGADTEQRADGELASQQWRLVPAGGGYYKIQNRNSGLILGVAGGSSADGAVIEQWTDGGWTSQHWQLVDAGGGFYKLRNRATGQGRRRLGRLAVERRQRDPVGGQRRFESALADRDRELIASLRRASSSFPTSSDEHDPVVLLV